MRMEERNIVLDKDNFLFRFNTTKKQDSHILDYIHGNSLIFGNCRKKLLDEEFSCYFCGTTSDSPDHQLIHCQNLGDETQINLSNTARSPEHAIVESIIPTNQKSQSHFIDRCIFLMEKHEFIEELKINEE